MTSSEIRQSFLDFFREKKHAIVPSSSLLPDSPNLLFTNAGMNQFVPIFLGQTRAPWQPPRAADSQKCIRAGGKHNDLDDVGLDTYHHTFFEMLGNWSFGDYFKKEAIEWAWELVVERWKFPAARLYATVYSPNKTDNDPSEFDQESHDHWAALFERAGLDPAVHIVPGNKKDNFWMMGETGPCGPCSELHVDLTPAGDTRGALVNAGDPRCIEIWNLVFIQFNANPDGTFAPLPQRHVDTGMGFERVTSIIQGTRSFTDFAGARISNYETDIFRPIFDELEKLSGHKYGSTLPHPNAAGEIVPTTEQEKVDVAFRVIADHIRTLSFAVADGIAPSNEGRGYVLRRILRRAVRYGRTLGFHEPFFFELVDVLARTMGDVFPEIRAKKEHVEEVLRREEEAFNRTLDRGIALFEAEVGVDVSGRVGVPPAGSGVSPERSSDQKTPANTAASDADPTSDAKYTRRRRLPHFEQPWAIYAVTISTAERRKLTPAARTIVLDALRHFHRARYELLAACVMPDHVHFLLQPWVKEQNERGEALFWPLGDLLHSIKSYSAKEINQIEGTKGAVWEQERFDRYVRGDRDLEEKYLYILGNPEREGLGDDYPWVWVGGEAHVRSGETPEPAGGTPTLPGTPRGISGEFAFTLYDTYGFPLDLTELMARERGLTVDVSGFEKLMEEQRARARAAQKKQVIELSEIETKTPTHFLGYDHDHTGADVQEVLSVKGKAAVIANNSVCYAEMGGQVGDTGEMTQGDKVWRIANTQKSGSTWLHFLEEADAALPVAGDHVTIEFDRARRRAIERHHTVTHLLHWALHEVVSREATQKGSFVGPEKLTFDFNSAALTPAQVRDIERLVNERILENAAVSWTEVPHAEVRSRADIMQFFGDKYGDIVRVVQIGGKPAALDGYSMELCAGTHTRATGEIGLFRIASEGAVAAGVRRIEAIAGLNAYEFAGGESERLKALAAKLGTPIGEMEKRVETMLVQQKELEKQLRAMQQRQAAEQARALAAAAVVVGSTPAIIENLGAFSGDELQAVADALKQQQFKGVVVLAGVTGDAGVAGVALVAAVSPEFTAKFQAGKIVQAIAPIVGGKGGGRPDSARGAGKEPGKIAEALAHARKLLG